jgi:type VI secretion system protein ImpF
LTVAERPPDRPQAAEARREAVQPSLWDRLVDDLPSLAAEIARLAGQLGRELGEERRDRLLSLGRQGIDAEADLEELHRRELRDLSALLDRRAFLEERGIVVTPEILREAVRRDIEALFNVERFESEPLLTDSERLRGESPAAMIADFPHVRRSVLNYGVPSFAGRRARDFDPERLARELREVVSAYEPRLKPETVQVRVVTNDRTGLRIELEAVLMMSPVPERLRLSTTIDLDSGRAATRLGDR